MDNTFDLLVLGGGPGGYQAALRAAGKGLKTALVEARDIGGTCLNRGCIPTKALLHCSGLFHEINTAGDYLKAEGAEYCPEQIQKYKNDVVTKMRSNVETMLRKAKVTVIRGYGKLTGNHEVTVGDEVYAADNIILATGSFPAKPPIPNIDGPDIMNSDGFLDLDHYGEQIVIVGGGVIGIELATFLGQLGKKVTVLEMMESILPGVDDDLLRWLSRCLKALGITVITSARVTGFEDHMIKYDFRDNSYDLPFDQCVIATGRKPHTADLAGEGVELKMERGFVVTDSHMRTSLDGVYAIGDITGHQQLAHVAEYQSMIAVENILGNDREACYENVPSCIYTSPEIACVGKNLRQLEGQDIITGRFNTGANGRAILSGAGNGTVRIYADKESHRLLGAQIMAPAATDMITEITALLNKNGTLEDIADTIHPHPTFAEIIKEAAADALHQ